MLRPRRLARARAETAVFPRSLSRPLSLARSPLPARACVAMSRISLRAQVVPQPQAQPQPQQAAGAAGARESVTPGEDAALGLLELFNKPAAEDEAQRAERERKRQLERRFGAFQASAAVEMQEVQVGFAFSLPPSLLCSPRAPRDSCLASCIRQCLCRASQTARRCGLAPSSSARSRPRSRARRRLPQWGRRLRSICPPRTRRAARGRGERGAREWRGAARL